ncbi:MAG: aminoglycoside phosphotransferase family protein [Mycobacterium sp.]|nr:aminoglycoside phosphotransferase family protein [Mycobacterium sp.]
MLNYLEDADFPYSPRVIGIADQCELLTYIDADSGDCWAPIATEDGLRAAAHMLRHYHRVVAAWTPDENPVWFTGQVGTGGAGQIVCHGDFAPWNILWKDGRPVGLLDWEYANIAPPLQDVAYALEYMAPFRSDEVALKSMGYADPPNRRKRLEQFAEAYGLSTIDGLVDEVIAVQIAGIDTVRSLAEAGYERQVAMVDDGELDRLQSCVDWTRQNRQLFE